MRGRGVRLRRVTATVMVAACSVVSTIALCTEAANAKKKSQPDSFEKSKVQTSFDQPGEQAKAQSSFGQKKESDFNDSAKQASSKGQDSSGQDSDKSGKNSDKANNDTGGTSNDTKNSAPQTGAPDAATAKPDRRTKETSVEGPPATIEEWLKGLSKPKLPVAEPVQVDKQGDKPVQTTQPQPNPASPPAPAPAKPSTHVVRDHPLQLDSPRAEILANDLSKESLKRATDQGFVFYGKAPLAQLDKTYTKLGAPVGWSVTEATEFLGQFVPKQELGANEAYLLYKPSTANAAKPDVAELTPPPAPMATECGTDRCFAQTLIGWRPQLQACAKNVRIGVVDTGIDQTHPTFKARRIETREPSKLRASLKRQVAPKWHGTGVLALLAGEPHSTTPGLISDASFFVADVFYADGDGLPVSDTASILEALNWLATKHVNIVNMSLTGPHDPLLKSAIEDLSKKGMLFVAAVGNDGPGAPPTFPSAYAPVVAVSAVNKDYANYRYANRGDHVDLAAPGVDIWTAMPQAQGTYHSGTSFAVPYATAMLASVFNSLANKTKAEALAKLSYVDLGVPGRDPVYGRGLAIAPYGCEMGPGTPLKPTPQPGTANVVAVKN